MSQFLSFAITIRPRNGLSEKTETAIHAWMEKQHHSFACIEKEGVERHLHGQLWFQEPKSKGDINKQLERICARTVADWSPAETRILRRGTKIAYNDDFVDEYLSKEDQIILNDPPADSSEYYPSEEEQNAVKAASNAVDKRFHTWSTDFKESQHYLNAQSRNLPIEQMADVARFMADQMFKSKKYPVVVEKRKRTEYTKTLYLYIFEKIDINEFLTVDESNEYMKLLEVKFS